MERIPYRRHGTMEKSKRELEGIAKVTQKESFFGI